MKLQENILSYITQNQSKLWQGLPDFVIAEKQKAFQKFQQKGLPTHKDEKWRKTNLKEFVNRYYHPAFNEIVNQNNLIDNCLVPDLKTYNVNLINGLFAGKQSLEVLNNGIIIGSFKEAIKVYPELVKSYFNRLVQNSDNPLNNLNTALFADGLFVFILKGISNFKL